MSTPDDLVQTISLDRTHYPGDALFLFRDADSRTMFRRSTGSKQVHVMIAIRLEGIVSITVCDQAKQRKRCAVDHPTQ